jgi:uncharacterized membrane protein YdjX (TVP38/TMEM64 family)
MIASLGSAGISFLLGGTLLAKSTRQAEQRFAHLQALDTVARERPITLAILWHLSLVLPFAPINVYMGAARVRWRDFLLGKVIGVLPGTTLYVSIGAWVPTLLNESVTKPTWTHYITGAGLVLSVGTLIWIGRLARRELIRLQGGKHPKDPAQSGPTGIA